MRTMPARHDRSYARNTHIQTDLHLRMKLPRLPIYSPTDCGTCGVNDASAAASPDVHPRFLPTFYRPAADVARRSWVRIPSLPPSTICALSSGGTRLPPVGASVVEHREQERPPDA